ncbi:hypothetical protein F2P56_036929 [Juglans regia]|uniref:Uncharacterized protein n=1 Tax=Juglans regia TaxID=51240 RepID=A0A833THP2_JUGRE|nr:hypothetical protein F2P56_036929 [Juglans regia]
MKRSGMTLFRPAGLRVLITVLVLIQLLPPASTLKNNHSHCAPSSCGNIPNISYPFRLKGDPPNCGDQSCRYDSCYFRDYDNQVHCKGHRFTFLTFLGYLSEVIYAGEFSIEKIYCNEFQ